jgi:hypothetical protein
MAHNMRLWLRERRETAKRHVAIASAAEPGAAGRHHQV